MNVDFVLKVKVKIGQCVILGCSDSFKVRMLQITWTFLVMCKHLRLVNRN